MERRAFIKNGMLYTAAGVIGASMLKSSDLFAAPHPVDQNTQLNTPILMSYENVSTTFKLKGKEVKVHALCTGTVAVKTAFRKKKGNSSLTKLNILLDNDFTEFMPIWLWIIEHPEGIIAVDTGEILAAKDIDTYLAKESSFSRFGFKHAAKYSIAQEDELNYQMDKINLKPSDVSLVVLTHLHLDHTDGLKFFPKQEIIIGETEYKHPNSNMPSTYPSWFKPNLVNYMADQAETFYKAYSITKSGDILYVPTPGHTRGHSSVIFKTDDFDIIFAGDTSYTQEQVLTGELAGVNQDFVKSKETYQKLLAYASKRPTIYLPTHDSHSGKRLTNRLTLG